MNIDVTPNELQALARLLDLYRHEAHRQIIHYTVVVVVSEIGPGFSPDILSRP
jgi:hypothetical protein